jgi:hypothetical protein
MQMKYLLRRCGVPRRSSLPVFSDGSEPSIENFEELKRFFRLFDAEVPGIPEHMQSTMIQDRRQQPWWASAPDINEMDFLVLMWHGNPSHLVDYLRPDRKDFVHIGMHPGRGGLVYGMICRIGPVLIAQQTVRHMNRTPPRSNQEDLTKGMHAFNTTWNDTFSSLQSLLNEDLRVVVLYSDIQNYAHIWSKAPEGTLAQRPAQQSEFISFERDRTRKAFIARSGRECDPIRDHNTYNDILREAAVYDELLKWNVVEDGRPENFEQRLQQLIDGPDEILAIAARHLLSLPPRRRIRD